MKVSVIIPTHNRANLVNRAIESVLKQTYQDFEIIVVSDGSSDDTDSVMRMLEKSDDRIKYISYQPARGGNFARNTGIQAAQYDYIALLDDDDEWLPEKLKKQMDVFKSDDEVGMVYSGVNLIFVKENVSYLSTPDLRGDLSKKILLKNYIGTTSTVVVKKSVLEKSGLFDCELGARQDYDLWIRVCQVTKIGVVSRPCINYYNYTGKQQISQQTEKYEKALDYIENKYSVLFTKLTKTERKVQKNNFYLLMANKGIRNNNKKMAIKYSRKAIVIRPSVKSAFFLFMSLLNYKALLRLRKVFRVNNYNKE